MASFVIREANLFCRSGGKCMARLHGLSSAVSPHHHTPSRERAADDGCVFTLHPTHIYTIQLTNRQAAIRLSTHHGTTRLLLHLSATRVVAPLPYPSSSVSMSVRLQVACFVALRESTDSKASLSFSPSQEHRSKAVSTRRRRRRAPRTGWDSRGRALAEQASAGRAWQGMGR